MLNITTAVLKSVKSRQCSNATLKGDYSYVQNGTVVGEEIEAKERHGRDRRDELAELVGGNVHRAAHWPNLA